MRTLKQSAELVERTCNEIEERLISIRKESKYIFIMSEIKDIKETLELKEKEYRKKRKALSYDRNHNWGKIVKLEDKIQSYRMDVKKVLKKLKKRKLAIQDSVIVDVSTKNDISIDHIRTVLN